MKTIHSHGEPNFLASIARPPAAAPARHLTVAVVGLGYVGLPTALALHAAGHAVVGIDLSSRRLADIRDVDVDLLPTDLVRLRGALGHANFSLSDTPAAMADADAVIVCVPTPVDDAHQPDLRPVKSACAAVVANARAGQTLILTSTTYVGTTRELLVAPLAERGLVAGRDLNVAFAPERVNPGVVEHAQQHIPRVVAGVTPDCTEAAVEVLAPTAARLQRLSSPEAAELTKLHENTFRAVNLALANELAAVAQHHGVDPLEIIGAASSKPYGYLAHYPGAGIGGHCIGVDPYYLLRPVQEAGLSLPLLESAMNHVAGRPAQVAERALEVVASLSGTQPADARLLVVGAAYKPGVADSRESPGVGIVAHLLGAGAQVEYHDPLVRSVAVAGQLKLSVETPDPAAYDLVVITTVHPDHDYAWLGAAEHVLDATYRTAGGAERHAIR